MTKAVLLTILIAVFGVAAQGPGKHRTRQAPKEPTPLSSPTPAPSPTPTLGIVANAGPDITVYAGESVRLDGTASKDVVANSWTTGDGYTIDSILKAPHAYMRPGTYTAKLTVADSAGNLSSDSTIVTVLPIATGVSQFLADSGDPEINKQRFVAALAAAASNPVANEIVVPAGMVINDTIYMPARSLAFGTYVTIRSSRSSELPDGIRVTAADRSKMFRIIAQAAGNGVENTAIMLRSGTNYFRFVGMDVVRTGGLKNDIVAVDYSGTARPSHIILDKVILDGNGTNTIRAFAPNGSEFSLMNSSIYDIKAFENESKAIGMWSGKGNLAVINNYLEAASINILIGGAYTDAGNMVDGVVFRDNHCYKNRDWIVSNGVGKGYAIKNLFELKAAVNVVAEGNTFENNWVDGQSGPSILFTVRGSGQPLHTIQNVSFRRNTIVNVQSGVNILPLDDESGPSIELRNIFIEQNRFLGVGDRVLILLPQLGAGGKNIHFKHNTVRMRPNAGALIMMDGSDRAQAFIESNDFGYAGEYGVFGSGFGEGDVALRAFLSPDSTFKCNLISFAGRGYPMSIESAMRTYPTTTYFSFTDSDSYDSSGTPYSYIVGTDGQIVGSST